MTDSRGQSTQIGAVLLVAVVVSVSAVGSMYVIDSANTNPEAPTVDLDGRVTAEADALSVVLTNMGGDPLPYGDLSVVVEAGRDSDRVTTQSVEGDQSLTPGETWQLDLAVNASPGDVVTVYVVHEPSGELLFEDEQQVPRDDATLSLSVDADSGTVETPGSTTLRATASHSRGEPVAVSWEVVEGVSYASLSGTTGENVTLEASRVAETRTATVRATATAGDVSTTRTATVTLTPAPDITAPNVVLLAYSLSPESIQVVVSSDEQLSSLAVDVDGPEDATLTLADFTLRDDDSGYRYEYTGDMADGLYELIVETATDDAGNDGSGDREIVIVKADDEEEEEEEEDEDDWNDEDERDNDGDDERDEDENEDDGSGDGWWAGGGGWWNSW